MHLVPPLMSFLGTSPDIKPDDLKSVRGIMGGAAPIGPEIIKSVLKKARKGFQFQEAYGMTEMR